jgi:hypothetical protein
MPSDPEKRRRQWRLYLTRSTSTFRFTGRRPFRWRFAEITPASLARWECVEGPGDSTVVECDHDGWPEGHDAYITCNTLWGILMGKLKEYAETSTPAPAFQ